MTMLVGIGLAIGGFLVGLWLIRRAERRPGASSPFFDPITTQRQEPCWTEEKIGNDGLSYGRGQCVNDTLMEADAKARWQELHGPRDG